MLPKSEYIIDAFQCLRKDAEQPGTKLLIRNLTSPMSPEEGERAKQKLNIHTIPKNSPLSQIIRHLNLGETTQFGRRVLGYSGGSQHERNHQLLIPTLKGFH